MTNQTETWKGAGDFKATVNTWASRVGVRPARVQIQHMTRKWASCSSNGTLSFNRELLEKERQFGEAVIVHELLHLRIPNHGKLFKSLFQAYLPEVDPVSIGIARCGSEISVGSGSVTENGG